VGDGSMVDAGAAQPPSPAIKSSSAIGDFSFM
jgi:hypothetical protein